MKNGPGRTVTGGRSKLQGTSRKLPRGASLKPQAPSLKLQAQNVFEFQSNQPWTMVHGQELQALGSCSLEQVSGTFDQGP